MLFLASWEGNKHKLLGVVATIILSCFVADFFGDDESSTLTVNVEVPIVVGVPVIVPVEGFRLKPVGNEPVDIDQV